MDIKSLRKRKGGSHLINKSEFSQEELMSQKMKQNIWTRNTIFHRAANESIKFVLISQWKLLAIHAKLP